MPQDSSRASSSARRKDRARRRRSPRRRRWSKRAASWLLLRLQLRAFLSRNVGERRMLAQLQRANIGDDRPAVAWPHAVAIAVHHAIAIGDDVEEMLVVRVAQARLMQARRLRHAALHDDAIAAAGAIMARR